MLRYQGESDLEAWLASCPLDPRYLTYGVTRAPDGLLTVSCSWRVAPQNGHAAEAVAADPAAASTARPPQRQSAVAATASVASECAQQPRPEVHAQEAVEAVADDAAARAAEKDRLQAMMAKMQTMMASTPAGAAALEQLASSGGGAADAMAALANNAGGGGGASLAGGGGAALAAALLDRRTVDKDGQWQRPSRDEIRAAIGLASGVPGAFPAAPGGPRGGVQSSEE